MRSADSSLSGVKQKTVHKPLWMRQLRAVVRSCEELCHKCDTKPVLIDKVDCFDEPRLLILRNLLKTQTCSKIPCYSRTRVTGLVAVRDEDELIASDSGIASG